MFNINKLAKVFNPTKYLVIEKIEDGYLVTDSYMVVKLSNDAFSLFKAKHNSKGKVMIPDDFEGAINVGTSVSTANENVISKLINDTKTYTKITMTDFIFLPHQKKGKPLSRRLFTGSTFIGNMSEEYYDIIKSFGQITDIRGTNEHSPIQFFSNGKVVAMVAPVRTEELKGSINSLLEVIKNEKR